MWRVEGKERIFACIFAMKIPSKMPSRDLNERLGFTSVVLRPGIHVINAAPGATEDHARRRIRAVGSSLHALAEFIKGEEMAEIIDDRQEHHHQDALQLVSDGLAHFSSHLSNARG